MTYEKWKDQYRSSPFSERLGQAFCNRYIKCQWPDLYYAECYFKADELITEYLIDNQYYPNMPEPLEP